ncbi:MAG: hypothetical protein JWR85_4184 [Marmoricola sp.]|jgi:hypothetical protein|nr:hypothetical protein [Marmoricola sp.]
MTALQYFRQFAAEFNNLADEVVTQWLSSAAIFVPAPDPVTEKSKLAQALYAAHLCWINKFQKGGHRGVVTAEKDGDLSRNYKPIEGADTFLGQSPYGMQYKNLYLGAFRLPAILTRYGSNY